VQRLASSVLLTVGLVGLLAACHPRERSEHTGQSGQTEEGRGHGGHGLRRACADDIAKFCQNEDKKRRCLRENLEKLSAECKTAVESGRGHKRDKDDSGDNND
jgi:hypothetical protein